MTLLPLIFGLAGGVCALLGIFTAVEVLPAFISGSTLVGSHATTTAFFWGLAVILLLASIATAVGLNRDRFD